MTEDRYPNLPHSQAHWEMLIEPAKNAYWQARRDNKTETDALLLALNEAFGIASACGWL